MSSDKRDSKMQDNLEKEIDGETKKVYKIKTSVISCAC